MNSKEEGKDPESDSKSDKKPALPDKIKQQLEEKGVQPEEIEKIIEEYVTLTIEQHFSGPLPPPHILAQYKNLIDNGAERIMVMAETQLSSRLDMTDRI
ncbi:MAG: hypothetical protein COC01_08890, partial [Bacteroidetes bacterium]